MNRWIAASLVIALLAGCQTSVKETKQKAELRWQQTRCRLLCGVAAEYFKSGQLDQAASKALEALALGAQNAEARLLLGKVYIEQEHYALAIRELERVCAERPDSPEAAFMLGVAQEKIGQLDQALASYRRSQALDPSKFDGVMAAAEVLVSLGRIQEAQVYVEGYLGLAGGEPGMFELAGRLALMVGDPESAARNYEQAMDLDPKNAAYREMLGAAHFQAAHYSQALEALGPLTRLEHYRCPARTYSLLGDCYLALKRTQDARGAYQKANSLDPANAATWMNLAKAALALGDVPRAIQAGQQALHLDGQLIDAVLVVGYAMLRQGQGEQALKLLTEAAGSFPDSSMLQCLLGRAYDAAGDRVQAARCYVAALKLEPENVLARELLAGAPRIGPPGTP